MTNRAAVAVPVPDWTTVPVGSKTSNLNGADRVFFLVKVATARTTTWPPGPAGVKMNVWKAIAKRLRLIGFHAPCAVPG